MRKLILILLFTPLVGISQSHNKSLFIRPEYSIGRSYWSMWDTYWMKGQYWKPVTVEKTTINFGYRIGNFEASAGIGYQEFGARFYDAGAYFNDPWSTIEGIWKTRVDVLTIPISVAYSSKWVYIRGTFASNFTQGARQKLVYDRPNDPLVESGQRPGVWVTYNFPTPNYYDSAFRSQTEDYFSNVGFEAGAKIPVGKHFSFNIGIDSRFTLNHVATETSVSKDHYLVVGGSAGLTYYFKK